MARLKPVILRISWKRFKIEQYCISVMCSLKVWLLIITISAGQDQKQFTKAKLLCERNIESYLIISTNELWYFIGILNLRQGTLVRLSQVAPELHVFYLCQANWFTSSLVAVVLVQDWLPVFGNFFSLFVSWHPSSLHQ